MPFEPKLNVLIAYPYLKQNVLDTLASHRDKIRFLMDSGAFTAFSGGKPIALDDYCGFIRDLPFKPWRYFTLDVIGDPEATRRNYRVMLERGFEPVPICTAGGDYAEMDEYFKTSSLVGIGGLVHQKPATKLRMVAQAMKAANGRNLHLLGFTGSQEIKKFRPYSADSSSWLQTSRYGKLLCYLGRGECRTIRKSVFQRKPPHWVLRFLQDMEVPSSLIARREAWREGYIHLLLSARSIVRFSLDVERVLGTKIFLACTCKINLMALIEAFDFIYGKYFSASCRAA